MVVTRPRLPVACWETPRGLNLREFGSILVRVDFGAAFDLRFFMLVAEETLEDEL